ncbi:MAG TPA: hypothetical protein VK473_11390, partial [Terriglobales bacterium]|nr:hypothetical protein [Terriglobales bacterium]
PSAPEPMQVAKVNSIYECTLPLNQRAAHRKGRNLRAGVAPSRLPLMIQGPLMLDFRRRRWHVMPKIENGEISGSNPATLHRLDLWRRAGISVEGRPEWCFIKLHCHGMIPHDEPSMLGALHSEFLRALIQWSRNEGGCQLHFVTAREMVNIILAACDGHDGEPGRFRDYRLTRISSSESVKQLAPQAQCLQPQRGSNV